MSSPRINPFRPNSPVNPGTFVGRLRELRTIEGALFQARAGLPKHFMLTGERGIGKTSLLVYLTYVAQGQIKVDGTTLRFLVINTDITPDTTPVALVQKVEAALQRQLGKSEKARTLLKDAWSFVQRIEAVGVKVRDAKSAAQANEVLLDDFAYSLATTANRICIDEDAKKVFQAQYDGVLLLIDEGDKAAPELDLGSFLKLLVERLQRHDCNRIAVGLAGLPNLRDVLHESHPSSLRLFDELRLDRLSPVEVGNVIDVCIAEGNRLNSQDIRIDPEARQMLIALSEGYPHFIQQFGYSAYEHSGDSVISSQDVSDSAFGKGGALETIGDRYYRDNFYNKIQKDTYRQVLRIMADQLDGWVTKDQIKTSFKGTETTLNNAIHALRKKGIMISKEGEKGIYRLQHKGFALWIKLQNAPSATTPSVSWSVSLSGAPTTNAQPGIAPDDASRRG